MQIADDKARFGYHERRLSCPKSNGLRQLALPEEIPIHELCLEVVIKHVDFEAILLVFTRLDEIAVPLKLLHCRACMQNGFKLCVLNLTPLVPHSPFTARVNCAVFSHGNALYRLPLQGRNPTVVKLEVPVVDSTDDWPTTLVPNGRE